MQIGTVAKKIGLTVDAIRFYERSPLLPNPPRSPGGFRQYGERDLETLGFIRRMQGLGFTLREIGELVDLRRCRFEPCVAVCRRLDNKLFEVRRKLSELPNLEQQLRAAMGGCKKELRKRSARCPVLGGSKRIHRESEN